jgi:two-component system LytT family sensor kinase
MKKGWQIFWHVLFWVSAISLFTSVAFINQWMTTPAIILTFVGYGLINVSLFYLNFLWLLPRFLDRNLYRAYGMVAVISIVGYALLKYVVALSFRPLVLMNKSGEVTSAGAYIFSAVITNIIFVFLSAALKFAVDWFKSERVQRDLENQRLTAELSFLKSQINPHFLFNSLNSIYSLAYQRSETTPEAILKLSEIMRYMLYECNDAKVDLTKELQYMQSYIDMQKIRYEGKVFVNFSVHGKVTNQKIAPLLLIAFIENAFKHGLANDPRQPILMQVYVKEEHQLYFYLHNKKHHHNRDAGGGIGMHNVKRRLELLYPGQYTMIVKNEPESYSCELTLEV